MAYEFLDRNRPKNNVHKKIQRTFSFAYEDGYQALEFLDEMAHVIVGGRSGYIISLILQDKQRRENLKKMGE